VLKYLIFRVFDLVEDSSPDMSEQEICPICKENTEWKLVTILPRFLFGLTARIVRCVECGIGKTLPPPQADYAYYEDNLDYLSLFSERTDLYRNFAKRLLSALDGVKLPISKRLLDMGSGGGFLLEVAEELGYESEGIEINAQLVQWCRSRNLRVIQGDVLKTPIKQRYDVIVASALIEHLPEPEVLFSICKEILNPGGVILMEQASYDGLLPRIFSWGWYGWQPKEHFWHVTPRAFSNMANRSKLRVLRLRRGSLYHPWFLRSSVKNIIGRNIAAVIGRIGHRVGLGDEFDAVLSFD
jgi:SAM-dependent methyltransferase